MTRTVRATQESTTNDEVGINANGHIEGRGCITFGTDLMATVSLVHANVRRLQARELTSKTKEEGT